MGHKVIKLTESDLTNILKRVIKEQDEVTKENMAIQCFLNKKGIKDNAGKQLVVDGKIGTLPNSKSAQAISKYQANLRVYPADGSWGSDITERMSGSDKRILDECRRSAMDSGFSDVGKTIKQGIDKGFNKLGELGKVIDKGFSR
jgi:hypothetical protein